MVQVVLDIERRDGGALQGHVDVGGRQVAFSGLLELVTVLEELLAADGGGASGDGGRGAQLAP